MKRCRSTKPGTEKKEIRKMLVKIWQSGSPVERITNVEGAALLLAQNPEEKFRLRPHDVGTDPLPRVLELLSCQYDCSLIHEGDLVYAHPRYA